MKRAFWEWGLTPGEKRALLLIGIALIIGGAYRMVQRHSLPDALPVSVEDSLAVSRIREAYFHSKDRNDSTSARDAQISDGPEIDLDLIPLDLNLASQRQLEALPGIGPVIASRIIELRAQKEGFRKVGELLEVYGIGEKRLEKIKPYVFCGEMGESSH